MGIFYELRYAVIIEIAWTFYLKSVPAKFKKIFKTYFLSYQGTSSSKLPCNPRHPSRNISCNHRHHLLQPLWWRKFSTSNKQKTMVDSDINSDYKASTFDKLYIRRRKWDTAGFVRAHQWKYWNALTVGRGHADNGCSCNHRAIPPSVLGLLKFLCSQTWPILVNCFWITLYQFPNWELMIMGNFVCMYWTATSFLWMIQSKQVICNWNFIWTGTEIKNYTDSYGKS